MDIRKAVVVGTILLVIGGATFADTGNRIENRLDNRGTRINKRS